MRVWALDNLQLEDGRVVAHSGVTDSMAMMEQFDPGKSE